MPIYSRDPIEITDPRQVATEATTGEAFGAGAYTMYEGLLGSMARSEELRQSEGTAGIQQFGYAAASRESVDGRAARPLSPLLDPEQARQQLRDNGLEQNLSIPADGIRQATLDILIARKRDELYRNQIMSESVGLGGVAANLAGSLAGSLVDPSNIGLAFVPVVGQSRYAQLLARAGGAFGRTGVRAGVGGLEGLAGLAPVEVFNYFAHQQQQSDYDAYDSMTAIAGGAFFGSALHGGAGLFSDFVMGGAKKFSPTVARTEPSLAPAPGAAAPPVLDMAARERLMVLDRLAEGRPVTRAQAEARLPRTGAEAGQIIDDALAELRLAADRGLLPPERVKALAAESDELAEVLRVQERADRDGVLLSPEARLTPEERAIADTRRQEIRAELEAHGSAQSAATRLEKLETKLSKIDSDNDLIRLTEEFSPVADDIAFVDALSPELRKELDADPLMPVRPFIAGLAPETQAASLRMAVAQAVSGRPVDISPALYTDAAHFSPDSAFASANRNASMVDGADSQASEWAASIKPLDDDIETARATVKEEEQFVKDMMESVGLEVNEAFSRSIADAELAAAKQSNAAKAAAMCMMRTGG